MSNKTVFDDIIKAATATSATADEIKQNIPKETTAWYNTIVQNDLIDTRKTVDDFIDYLDAFERDDTTKNDDKEYATIISNVLKQLNSGGYFYNFERLFDLFPTTDAVQMRKPKNPDYIEKNTGYKTYMYALPKDFNKGEYNTKIKIKDPQRGEDYGISYRVLHEDKKMQNFSSILGVEYMLDVLNKTGSNVNYLNDYFFKDDKPDPVYINNEVVYDKIRNYHLKPTKIKT